MSVNIFNFFSSSPGPLNLTCEFLESRDLAAISRVSKKWYCSANSDGPFRAIGGNLGCDFSKYPGKSMKDRLTAFALKKLDIAQKNFALNPESSNPILALEKLNEYLKSSSILGPHDHSGPCTLLQRSILKGDYKKVKVLVEDLKVDPSKSSFEGPGRPDYPSLESTPPLVIAIGQIGLHNLSLIDGLPPRKKCAELLLKHKANVNAQDFSGFTALHAAVKIGDIDLVKLILANDADRSLVDMGGKTAYDIAVQQKKTEIASLIKK